MEENGSAMLVYGRRQWVTYRDDAIGMDDFAAIGASFEQQTNEVVMGKVADATVRLMRQRPLVDYAVYWLEAHHAGPNEQAQTEEINHETTICLLIFTINPVGFVGL